MGADLLRVIAGLLWLSNVSWKIPPDFGDTAGGCRGLCGYVAAGADNPVLPGSSWLFDSVVGPNLVLFGWLTLFVEAGLAACLLSGRFIRVAAVVGILQSFAIGLAVANAEGEWYWSYGLMVALHLAILALAPATRRTAPVRVCSRVSLQQGCPEFGMMSASSAQMSHNHDQASHDGDDRHEPEPHHC